MILNISFDVTLDAQYLAPDGRSFGLLGKKANHLVSADGRSLMAYVSIEYVDDDYRGDAIAGKKGDRFVYFGLEQDGAWLRRWKLRQHQLDTIFAGTTDPHVTVSVKLGKEVTPVVSLTS